MSLGFQNAGFEIIAAFDNWEVANHIYQQNFTYPVYNLDLGQVNGRFDFFRQFQPEIIVGGPPCQDFSHAGKRNEELGRADLTLAFAEIVTCVKPQFFVMENVDRAANSKRFATARKFFREAGYGLTERILDASLCGVPQKRKRVFLIGELKGQEGFLGCYLDKGLSPESLTVRQYFRENFGQDPTTEYYYRHPRNYSRRAVYSIDEPSATIRGVNRPIPASYCKHPADAAPISALVRPLTTLERSYIQTFPQGFFFTGTKSNMEQMIGNAVPVKLAEYVATAVQTYQNDKAAGRDVSTWGQLNLFREAFLNV